VAVRILDMHPAGGLWFCEAHWIRTKDVDILWNTRVCRTRDHTQQRTWPCGWLLVAGHSHVRTTNWQVLAYVHPVAGDAQKSKPLPNYEKVW